MPRPRPTCYVSNGRRGILTSGPARLLGKMFEVYFPYLYFPEFQEMLHFNLGMLMYVPMKEGE